MITTATTAAIRRDDKLLDRLIAGIRPDVGLPLMLWAWRQRVESVSFPHWRHLSRVEDSRDGCSGGRACTGANCYERIDLREVGDG